MAEKNCTLFIFTNTIDILYSITRRIYSLFNLNASRIYKNLHEDLLMAEKLFFTEEKKKHR